MNRPLFRLACATIFTLSTGFGCGDDDSVATSSATGASAGSGGGSSSSGAGGSGDGGSTTSAGGSVGAGGGMSADVKAFPSAVGFGKDATGGRGGVVMVVDNLNDSGPGSLRAAVDAAGPRVVVFRVAGNIELESTLEIDDPDITIAGQTSPGGGITLQNFGLNISTSNVVVRYLRVRLGDNGYKNAAGQVVGGDAADSDTIGIRGGAQGSGDIILDHMSVSWSIDENIGFFGGNNPIDGVTVQRSIISEGLSNSHHNDGGHSMGTLINQDTQNVTFYSNLWAHNSERHIRAGLGCSFEMVNNLLYNFRFTTVVSYENKFTVINNIYKAGATSVSSGFAVDLTSSGGGDIAKTSAMVMGNVSPMPEVDSALMPYLVATPPLDSGVVPQPTAQLDADVLLHAGANYPHRDAVDDRVVADYAAGTGTIIDTQAQVGGYPVLPTEAAPTDSDNDGMPDDWETTRGLNPGIDDSALDDDADGYTNVEEYVNSLVGE